MKKYLSFLLGLILFLVYLDAQQIAANKNITKEATQQVENTTSVSDDKKVVNGILKVSYIDVGQADSILIQQGSNSMLIDAGNNADSELVKNYITDQGITKLDVVIGTHPHEDHIGGLDYIINSFKIVKIHIPKKTATTKTFEDVINAIKSKGLKVLL